MRTPFSWELQTFFLSKKGPRRSKFGGIVKTPRHSNSLFFCYRRSIFSTEGSFGLHINNFTLDGQNRAIVIAESLARVIAAIRIAAFVGGHISLDNTEISPHRPCVRCAAIQIARLAFIDLTFVPHGTVEWLATIDRVRGTLAIGDFAQLKNFAFPRLLALRLSLHATGSLGPCEMLRKGEMRCAKLGREKTGDCLNPLVLTPGSWKGPLEVFTVLCDRRSAAYWNSLQIQLSFLLHTWQPLCNPNSHSWGRLFQLPGG